MDNRERARLMDAVLDGEATPFGTSLCDPGTYDRVLRRALKLDGPPARGAYREVLAESIVGATDIECRRASGLPV